MIVIDTSALVAVVLREGRAAACMTVLESETQVLVSAGTMTEALIVNPYDTEQCATALRVALDMPPVEQRERMRSMRSLIQEFNVYRWAGRMLLDAARMRHRRRLASGARRPSKVIDLRRA